MAYLVGRKEFYSLPLAVSPGRADPPARLGVRRRRVPRRDSRASRRPAVVDVGTGSGCLALACAQHHKTARFVAIDISPEALAVAAANAEALGLADRVEFRQGDLLEPGRRRGPVRRDRLEPALYPDRRHPDARARRPRLRAPPAPSTAAPTASAWSPRLIAAGRAALLKPGGHLILEIGSDQEEPVRALIAAQPPLKLAPTVRDHANHPAGGPGDEGNWMMISRLNDELRVRWI